MSVPARKQQAAIKIELRPEPALRMQRREYDQQDAHRSASGNKQAIAPETAAKLSTEKSSDSNSSESWPIKLAIAPEAASKLPTEESPDCNSRETRPIKQGIASETFSKLSTEASRESRHLSRDDESSHKLRRSMSIGRRNHSKMRRSRSKGRSPSAGVSPSQKLKQVSAFYNLLESTSSSGDGDQAIKLRRSQSMGEWKPIGDEDSPTSVWPSKLKSDQSRTSSRGVDQLTKMRRSKSMGRYKPTGDGDSTIWPSKPKARESRTSSRDGDQSSKMRRFKSTGRKMSSDNEGGAHAEEASTSRESRTSSRDGDQSSKMRRSESMGSKSSRESRSSPRDDLSTPTKRSKSKGPSQRYKDDPSRKKTPSGDSNRTVIRMTSKELMEAGFDTANMPTRPKSSGKSKGGKERILVSGLDAKDMASRVLERRKSKKVNDKSTEVPKGEPTDEPFGVSDFNLGIPQAPELEA